LHSAVDRANISDMITVQTLIDEAGGVVKFSRMLGVSHSSVCDWNRTGFIPARRIVQISRVLGRSIESIASLAQQDGIAQRRPNRRRAA
jgi:DNA-binding transcriptional regulator YdaS (Cro superfamily)